MKPNVVEPTIFDKKGVVSNIKTAGSVTLRDETIQLLQNTESLNKLIVKFLRLPESTLNPNAPHPVRSRSHHYLEKLGMDYIVNSPVSQSGLTMR